MPKETLIFIIKAFISLLCGFICSYFINKFLIISERKKSIAQAIRDDIVSTHQAKSKTPTMGGIGIVVSTIIVSLIINYNQLHDRVLISFLISLIGFFMIGFVDDYLKVKKKNSKGLSALFRLLLEIFLVMFILYFLNYDDKDKWKVVIPISHGFVSLGFLFIPLVIFMIVGSSNAVNMADGLDGLASGLVFMAITPFIVIFIEKEMYAAALFLLALDGAISGFLTFNFHPAKIFMGDCGSLPLGAVLALSALVSEQIIILLVAGGLFIVETMSVILQVASYKSFHKRIFKMAPLHHHFEMKGVAEWKVVMVFYVVGYLLSFLALILGVI